MSRLLPNVFQNTSTHLKGGAVAKVNKGLKGSVGGVLVTIPECIEELEEGVGEEGKAGGVVVCPDQGVRVMEEVVDSADKVVVDLPQGIYLEGGRVLAIEDVSDCEEKKIECSNAPLLVTNESALMLSEMDNVLDLSEAQPLQNMTFLIPRKGPDSESSIR